WRVSLYPWTKGIAAGAYLVSILLLIFMRLAPAVDLSLEESMMLGSKLSIIWQWVAPVMSAVFLAVTGGLLIWDLEHPARFYMIFTRPHWRSWLVKGAFIIAGYSLVLLLHLVVTLLVEFAGLLPAATLQLMLALLGLPLAVLTAVYTAYPFAQAKARDLWQIALLPAHLPGQSLLLGVAAF